MLRFVTKADFWDATDRNLLHVSDWSTFSIKQIQDAVLRSRLLQSKDLDIIEVGGGNSRTLPMFCEQNRCINIDPVEGSGHGPVGIDEASVPWRHVFRKVGETADVLPDACADVVYSISVLEHVIFAADIKPAIADMARLLRPGGRMVHLVDAYVEDRGEKNAFALKIAGALREALNHPALEPTGDVLADDDVYFRGAYATNPDTIMHDWNKAAPRWLELRTRSQACSFLFEAVKRG